jgi:hypothetical protein
MELPSCFGRWWEAIPGPTGDACRQCMVSDDCLQELATNRYHQVNTRLGNVPLSVLSEALGVDEQAVLVIMAKAQQPRQTPVKEVQVEKRKIRRWGPETHEKRWLRERERHPEIGALTPGTKLSREFKGVSHDVMVKQGGYEYQDTVYPTLAKVTSVITGEHSKRKTTEFWQLKGAD